MPRRRNSRRGRESVNPRRTIDITVPEGARAGDRLQVPVPPLSPSAGPDGDAADWDEGPDDLDEIEEME